MDTQDFSIRHFEQMAEAAAALKALPAQVLSHSYHYEAFGSWNTAIRFRGRVFRAIFDGKEQAYSLEESVAIRPPYSWKPICVVTTPSDDPWKAIVEAIVCAAG
jgi:hypothetical protein